MTRRRLFDPAVELVGPGPRPLVTLRVPCEPLDHGLRVDLLLCLFLYAAEPGASRPRLSSANTPNAFPAV